MKRRISGRLLSAAMAAALCCSIGADTVLAYGDVLLPAAVSYEDSEPVEVFVKLKGDAVLASPEACGQGADYIDTDAGRAAESAVLAAQSRAEKHIRRLYPELEIKRRFTLTANGFTCTVPEALIDEIAGDSLVAGVTELRTDIMAEPQLADAKEACGVTGFCSSTGCTGEGEVIAVLDTEFDVTHDMFAPLTGTDVKLSREDISEISGSSGFSSKLSADGVYISSKIPFAYDYSDDTPYTLSAPSHYHGTHVSGIAAGNRITGSDGREISGVAPDAQLLMMKVYGSRDGDEDGAFAVSDEAVAAAVEDAVKLRADVINMSFGRVYECFDELVYADSIAAAVNAGITVCASAGNRPKVGSGSGKNVTAGNVDTGYIDEPSIFPEVLSVASADNAAGGASGSPVMSSFSSCGVSTSLDLKPEITGIGGNVVSAAYGNTTSPMSGTSMASPYIAGCAALCDQKMKNDSLALTGRDRVQRIKNVLMNSAVPCAENGMLLSPRRQGAGLAALDRAADDCVIMTGASGKAAIELRDGLGEQFSFELDITNTGSEDVTFPTAELSLSTDGYVLSTDPPKAYISGQTALIAENDLGSGITVPAGETVTRTVSVELDREQTALLSGIFTNGFFVEGYVSLSGAENCCDISIPLLGFFGDWCAVPTVDTDRYPMIPKVSLGDGEIRTDISLAKAAAMLRDIVRSDIYLLNLDSSKPEVYPVTAENLFTDEQKVQFRALSDGISYVSPDSNTVCDRLGCYYVPSREAVFSGIDLCDSEGELVYSTIESSRNSYETQLALLPYDTYTLPDGAYSGRISSYIGYGSGKDKKQTYPVDFVIDTKAPEVTYETVTEDGRDILKLTAKDSALDGIYIMGMKAYADEEINAANFNALALAQRTLCYNTLPETRDRIMSHYPGGTPADEQTDLQAVLAGSIKPKNYYNYCDIIPAEPDENGTFSISYDITGLGEYSVSVTDRALNEYSFHSGTGTQYELKTGLWRVKSDREEMYYEFGDNGVLTIMSMNSRSWYSLGYKVEDGRLKLWSDYKNTADITWSSPDRALLYWEGEGVYEDLTYVGEGSVMDCSFFTNEELNSLAVNYCRMKTGAAASRAWTQYNANDGSLSVTVYDENETIAGVYTINREDATGVDENGEPVDLKEGVYFNPNGIWCGCTKTDGLCLPRFMKIEYEFEGKWYGYYADQSDGIGHPFNLALNDGTVEFSFDSYESTGKPTHTAGIKLLDPQHITLTWDNGFVEEFTINYEYWVIDELGFMTNKEIEISAVSYYVKSGHSAPDRTEVRYAGTADEVLVDLYSADGELAEQYRVSFYTGSGTDMAGNTVDLKRIRRYLQLGDVNADDVVDAKDSSDVLIYYSKVSTGKSGDYLPEQLSAADVNDDQKVDAKDASVILGYYSYVSTGGTLDLAGYYYKIDEYEYEGYEYDE